jgi:hypothetical protein
MVGSWLKSDEPDTNTLAAAENQFIVINRR